MKKYALLGKSLSKAEQKKIIGGEYGGYEGGSVCVSCPAPSPKGTMCGPLTCVADPGHGLNCWSKSCDCWVYYSCY